MKKLFTLLMLMVCAVGTMNAAGPTDPTDLKTKVITETTLLLTTKANAASWYSEGWCATGKASARGSFSEVTNKSYTIDPETDETVSGKKWASSLGIKTGSDAKTVYMQVSGIEKVDAYLINTSSSSSNIRTARLTIIENSNIVKSVTGDCNGTASVKLAIAGLDKTKNYLLKFDVAEEKSGDMGLYAVRFHTGPQKTLSDEKIIGVTINGTDNITNATDLENLNTNHTLTYSEQYSIAPTVVFTTEKTYEDDYIETGTYDAAVTSDETNFIATATINGIEYKILMGISKDPVLQSDVKSINIKSGKVTPLATQDITITGNNLFGEASISFPTVDGLSISPSTINVVDGKIDAKLTVSYTSLEEVAETNTNMSISVGETVLDIPIVYSSSAASTNIKSVSEATTWDFSKTGVTSDINLNSEGNPTTVDEFILSDATEYIKADATFDAEAIAVGAVARFNKAYFQGKVIKIKTTVPGTITVKFSDTGSKAPRKERTVVVNGVSSSSKSNNTTAVTTEDIEVAAGEITINGAYVEDGSIQPLRFYSLTFTPLEAPASITLNSYGYNTYSNANTVTVSGAVAYTCTVNNETKKVVLKELGTVVPAGQGVLLKGEANGTVSFAFGGEEPVIEQNDFQPVLKAVATPADKAIYVLNGNQFKKYTGATLVANKAYIELGAGTAAAALSIEWDGGTTGIGGIEESVVDDNVPVYNLNGQRVAINTKGIIIKNGKKIINK